MTVPVDGRRSKRPVVGDGVVTGDRFYGVVLEERGRGSCRQLLVLVIENPGVSRELWVPANRCVPVHGGCGSYERCEAVDDNVLCERWAVRSVTAIPVDARGRERVDADGYAVPGLVPERRAVCWGHLPAAVFWAEQRFGPPQGEIRIGDVHGGSARLPVGVEDVLLGGLWGTCYTLPPAAVEAVGR